MTVSVSTDRPGSILASHHPVGASTGYMESLRGSWEAQVAEAIGLSPFAVELSALAEDELDSLIAYMGPRPKLPFRYLSIHGPSKARRLSEEKLVARLLRLAPEADAIVMHPDTIVDPLWYRPLGRKLVLENMDSRKTSGRTADELQPLFDELPNAGFCFDIAHAWSIDPDMGLGGELLDAFGQRLRHLHISSLSPNSHHLPLSAEDEHRFHPLLARCLDMPWILEAPPRGD
jgi:hypothetical protein